MKMKRHILALAAITLAACSQIDNPSDQRVPVTLISSTAEAVESKAAQDLNETTFDSGEAVKVLISETGQTDWGVYDFTTGDGGTMSPTTIVPYYPAGLTNIDIAAYYPSTAGTSFTVAFDQTADASYKSSDLMFASVTDQAKQASAVTLTFAHKMAKLNVNVTPGEGVASIIGVDVLNVLPTVSFNQTTGATGSATGPASTITMSNNGAALIPAQTIDGGFLSIVTNKGTAIYSVSDKVFEAGKQYTLNITVNLRAVGTTTAITGWTSEGTVNIYPVAEALTVLNVTDANVGWVITGDGSVYQNKAAVTAAGKTGVALIFYVGAAGSADASSSIYRGLAVSLTKVSSTKYWGWTEDGSYCLGAQPAEYTEAITDMNGIKNTMTLAQHSHIIAGYDRSHLAAQNAMNHTPAAPSGTSGWFLGSMGQWSKYLTSNGVTPSDSGTASGALSSMNALFKAAGYEDSFSVSNYDGNKYSTSTEAPNNSGYPHYWYLDLYDYTESGNVFVTWQQKMSGAIIRPFTAF